MSTVVSASASASARSAAVSSSPVVSPIVRATRSRGRRPRLTGRRLSGTRGCRSSSGRGAGGAIAHGAGFGSCSSSSFSNNTLEVGDFAKLDLGRTARTGMPEVVWGPGKTPEQIVRIMGALRHRQSVVMATRITPEAFESIRAIQPEIEYDPVARICRAPGAPDAPPVPTVPGVLAVLTAGTADLSVAEEAASTAKLMGVADVRVIADIGVAGLHRLLAKLDDIREADVVVVVAGMDCALPSVVAGLVDAPVIAVPTSVGYGAAMGGLSPLMAALNSCAVGVTVVNIDNGFGGAMAGVKMLRMAQRLADRRGGGETQRSGDGARRSEGWD